MKAFLLAAGLGTRLRPLTDSIPKCLVKVEERPLLEWWILLFEKYGITDVLINTHYLSEQVEEFIFNYKTKINFHIYYEKELLGSAGTIYANKDFIGKDSFLVVYADNLTNFNFRDFVSFHQSHTLPFTMALFKTDTPRMKGIVELDKENTIISFEEKPKNPKTNLANAGIYIANPEILNLFEAEKGDIGFDILPKLVGSMKGFYSDYYLLDIGTTKHLELANKEWRKYKDEF